MVDLQATPAGVILPVRALAGARRSGLRGEQAGALKVAVTQIAERGRANEAIATVLCQALRLRNSQVQLLAGATSANKKFLITAVSLAELAAAVATALTGIDAQPPEH